MRNVMVSLAACILLCGAAYAGEADSSVPVGDDARPDGAVTLSGGSVAAGIGYTWGHGELKYRESSYQFSIKGVSVVDVGATNFAASGDVYTWASFLTSPGTMSPRVPASPLPEGAPPSTSKMSTAWSSSSSPRMWA
jgi:hypothetical protein